MTTIQEGIVYWIKLFLVLSCFIFGFNLLYWFVVGHWSNIMFIFLELGSGVLTSLYVLSNWNNPLGFCEITVIWR
jgi:hypothetical protein